MDDRLKHGSPQVRPATTIEKCLVILRTYNEADSISHILNQIQSHVPGAEILVVDDSSHDETADMVRRSTVFGKTVHYMNRSSRNSLCSDYNHKEVFEWALLRGYGAVVEMNSDLSHDPADIRKLLNALDDGTDMAVGSRYLNGVRVLNCPQSKLWISSLGSSFVRLLTGLSLTDPTSGFNAIRRRVLEEFEWQKFTFQTYAFEFELYFFATQAGFRIVEVPIVFTDRRNGKSQMSTHIVLEAAKRALQLAVRRVFP